MMRHRAPGGRRDHGFTLVEVLVVISILGVIVSTLGLAFVVIIRTTPQTETRVDDARSTRGLATWLAYDTTSAPPFLPVRAEGGIDVSPGANRCLAPLGDNIMELVWREAGFTNTTWVAGYRYVITDGEARIVRHTCSGSGSVLGAPTSISLTAGLDPATPPTVTANYVGTEVASVDLRLTATSGTQVLIETGSRNPVEYYP